MQIGEVKTMADAGRYLTERTPAPVRRWYGLQCPRCRARFFSSLFFTRLSYKVHYMDHLLDDLRGGNEDSGSADGAGEHRQAAPRP